jgi:hypothetical protein
MKRRIARDAERNNYLLNEVPVAAPFHGAQ